MSVICRYRLTTAEAEDFIAMLWRSLEEHGIPSPRLNVRQIGEALDFYLEFLSEKDAALITEVVPPPAEPSLPEPALTPLRRLARPDAIMQAQIGRWRMRAEELRTNAEQFSNPSAQRSLLSASANYERLAENAERSLAGQSVVPDDKIG
jgi:hypothetical protein